VTTAWLWTVRILLVIGSALAAIVAFVVVVVLSNWPLCDR